MAEVSFQATPLTEDETAFAFLPAYAEVFHALPDLNRAELLLALAWIENARGRAFIRYNWGNQSTTPEAGGDYWRPPWFDLEKVEAMPEGTKRDHLLDLHARMLQGASPSAFSAFDSHEAGARAWMRLLAKPRYAPLLAAASSGDAQAFAQQVFDTGYCPDAACRTAGPSYDAARRTIASRGYFLNLKKKILSSRRQPARTRDPAERAGLWFWAWGLLLSRRIRGYISGAGSEAA
jgi:hypothetical protein